MASFIDDAKRLFGSSNLYDILRLFGTKQEQQNFKQSEIKKAFFKLSLCYHPDRCHEENEKTIATEKFQVLNKAYVVLSDKKQRKLYNETGVISSDDCLMSDDTDWLMKWRNIFKKVTKNDIENFVRKYRESGEEHEDIKKAYVEHKGDMGKIMEFILGTSYTDESRIRMIIEEMVENGELKALKRFTNESTKKRTKRIEAAEKEAKEAAKLLREIETKEGSTNLVCLIQNRRKTKAVEYDSFCDQLAVKYANHGEKKKRRKH